MRKLKITSFDKEGVRGGRSLESVLSELETDGDGEGSVEGKNNETTGSLGAQNNEESIQQQQLLHICRLSFTSVEKARAMGRLISSSSKGLYRWSKIVLEKTSGRFVSLVVQDCVASTRVLQVKQHQRYDSIKWNFGIDWFPTDSDCPLEEIHFTGVRFRGGEELEFLRSLRDCLERSTASACGSNGRSSIGLRVLELNACRFLHPETQYPILFEGLRAACFGTLERLWMPKSPGLNDDRFVELFGEILQQSCKDKSCCSLVELGFSYNGCAWKGSTAVSSFLRAPQSANLKVLYLNRQHGELDLQGILQSAATRTGTFQLNLSQNYVSSLESLEQLRSTSNRDFNGNDDATPNALNLAVQLDSMSFEVPEAVIPGNNGGCNGKVGGQQANAGETKGTNGASRQRSYEDHLQNLTQEEIAKLNVACGRVKYVLGRAAAARDRNNDSSSSSSSAATPVAAAPSSSNPWNNTHENGNNNGSDWFFSSLAALDCVLPDLVTILRLQEKQNVSKSNEGKANTDLQHIRQYRNWLPTFLRKAIKGNIEILKPWLLSASQESIGADLSHSNEKSCRVEGATRPLVVLTDSEKERLAALWNEIETLHTNISKFAGQRRHKHSEGNNLGERSAPSCKAKHSRNKKHNRKSLAEIPMTPEENPLVKAAYEEIPAIPTSVLESCKNFSSFLSLPMETNQESILEIRESKDIRPLSPQFIDTVEGLEKLRDDLFRKPPPHKIPKMVAVDSEWYFTDNEGDGETPQAKNGTRPKRVKHRSMSVATLQIAYVDENQSPMVLRSFVIDLLSNQPGFQDLAKDCVSWLFGSASCDTIVLGFAFGGDLRQLRKYAGITGKEQWNESKSKAIDSLASLERVAARCLDIQLLLSSPEDIRKGRVPGLKKCAELYFQKPLKKDDQTSDWMERPLRPSQLEYAALDAVILLVLLSQKKQHDERNASTTTTMIAASRRR